MNINLIGSYIIGGLLLLSVLGVNGMIIDNSVESIADYQVKNHMSTIAEVLSNDLRKLGYQYTSGFPVDSASTGLIQFSGDVTGDGDADVIQWVFDRTMPDLNTDNPADTSLFRIVNGDTTDFSGGVIVFAFTYYDSLGAEITGVANMKSIQINLICESKEAINSQYIKSVWRQRFRPINLDIF